jgi:hypothetical protein
VVLLLSLLCHPNFPILNGMNLLPSRISVNRPTPISLLIFASFYISAMWQMMSNATQIVVYSVRDSG